MNLLIRTIVFSSLFAAIIGNLVIPSQVIAAKNKYNINMKESWMVGDSERDITAASLAGIKNTILVRSGHQTDKENSHAKYKLNSIKDIRNIILF